MQAFGRGTTVPSGNSTHTGAISSVQGQSAGMFNESNWACIGTVNMPNAMRIRVKCFIVGLVSRFLKPVRMQK